MKARELMKRCPDVVTPGASITSAAELMHYCDDAFVPVVRDKESSILVGVITARDIVVRCMARHHGPACQVREHMTPMPLHTLAPDDDVLEAVRMMRDWEIRRVPVVTSDGVLLGVLRESDLQYALESAERRSGITRVDSRPNQVREPMAAEMVIAPATGV